MANIIEYAELGNYLNAADSWAKWRKSSEGHMPG